MDKYITLKQQGVDQPSTHTLHYSLIIYKNIKSVALTEIA